MNIFPLGPRLRGGDGGLSMFYECQFDDFVLVDAVGVGKPLPFDDVLRILRPVADALDYAHSESIIHRDIKPSSIFVELDKNKVLRNVQVIDFGLASEIRATLTRVSQIRFDNSGTRPYMAPEQWRGRRHQQTVATDQYALGVVAYELLDGYLPFESDDTEMLRLTVFRKNERCWFIPCECLGFV